MPIASAIALCHRGHLLHVLAEVGREKGGSWGWVGKPRGSGEVPEKLVCAAGSVRRVLRGGRRQHRESKQLPHQQRPELEEEQISPDLCGRGPGAHTRYEGGVTPRGSGRGAGGGEVIVGSSGGNGAKHPDSVLNSQDFRLSFPLRLMPKEQFVKVSCPSGWSLLDSVTEMLRSDLISLLLTPFF